MTISDYESGYAQALEDLGAFIRTRSERRAGTARTTPQEGIGSRLRALREKAGLTQSDLADAMRYFGHPFNQQTIYKLEVGSRRLLAEEVSSLAECLNVEPVDLL